MLLDAVVIVLREVLEAALLISLLLALGMLSEMGRRWLWVAFVVGGLAAVGYAANIASISESFDYAGQELLNASLQGCIWLAVLGLFVISQRRPYRKSLLALLMALTVALALARELSEILLYVQSYGEASGNMPTVLAGALIGLITGSSVGVLMYFSLLWLGQPRIISNVAHGLLAVVIGGILTQSVSLLEQVDYLPALAPLWDSSSWLPERSLAGQLLYALLGYEATPSAWHLAAYLLGLGSLAAVFFWQRRIWSCA